MKGRREMSEELEHLLKNLRLRRILEIYDEQLRAADKGDISTEFLTRLPTCRSGGRWRRFRLPGSPG
jgi:hypothetical protein